MANFMRFNFTTHQWENSITGPTGTFTQVGKGVLGGAEAAMPAAGIADRLYVAFDTGQIYADDGTQWAVLLDDYVVASELSNYAHLDGGVSADFAAPPQVNGAALHPEWLLVDEVELSAAALDHTFSGLNGDLHKKYRLTWDGDVPAGGATYPTAQQLAVLPNGDTASASYLHLEHRVHWNGSAMSHDVLNPDYAGMQLARSDWSSGGQVIGSVEFDARTGGPRVGRSQHSFLTNAEVNRIMYDSAHWYVANQGTNITSIRVRWTNGTGDLLTGTLRLFRSAIF